MIHLKGFDVLSRVLCSSSCPRRMAQNGPGNQRHTPAGSTLLNHSVVLSSSKDIHTNLALEDWIYKNSDFSDGSQPLLLLWRNDPCVVIGRHQNPWTECKLLSMARHGVQLARRNSGGGTVYHDLGNLNCTFFSQRSKYDRKRNLRLICNALRGRWPTVDVAVSPREDIVLDGTFKISGTAAKLGRMTAYHHCTVLFDADTSIMSHVLKTKPIDGVESKATRSIASPVRNLRDVIPSADFDSLVAVIGDSFRREYQLSGGVGAEILTPSEVEFPGLMGIREELRSWEWTFGKCPLFRVERRLQSSPRSAVGPLKDVALIVRVNRGIIEEISFKPDHWMKESSKTALTNLVGRRFPFQKAGFDEPTLDFGVDESEETLLGETIMNCVLQLL